MSQIEFVSHESFPDDEYTKELVYLSLEGKYRIAYVRKSAKNGGMFWSVASVGATKNGKKEYYEAFMQDSNFLEKDIRNFLDNRSWEGKSVHESYRNEMNNKAYQKSPARAMDQISNEDELPF